MSRWCQRQVKLELQTTSRFRQAESRTPVSGLTVLGLSPLLFTRVLVDTADPGRRPKQPLTGCRPLRPPPRTGRETRRRGPREAGEGWARGGWAACNGPPGSVTVTIPAHPIDCQTVAEPPIPWARSARIGG